MDPGLEPTLCGPLTFEGLKTLAGGKGSWFEGASRKGGGTCVWEHTKHTYHWWHYSQKARSWDLGIGNCLLVLCCSLRNTLDKLLGVNYGSFIDLLWGWSLKTWSGPLSPGKTLKIFKMENEFYKLVVAISDTLKEYLPKRSKNIRSQKI